MNRRIDWRLHAERSWDGFQGITAVGTGVIFDVPAQKWAIIEDASISISASAAATAQNIYGLVQSSLGTFGQSGAAASNLCGTGIGFAASATLQSQQIASAFLSSPTAVYGGPAGNSIQFSVFGSAVLLGGAAFARGYLLEDVEMNDVWLDESIAARIAQIVKGGQVAG